jgi:ribosome-binding factor A
MNLPNGATNYNFQHFILQKEDVTMASNRIGRINEEIQKELASLLRNLKDPRVQNTMISITRVETTPDLRYAKVYVSFLEEAKASDALKGLKSAGGYLRRELGRALNLRYTPELVWALDDSITYGAKMLKLINSLEVRHDEQPDEE